MIEKIYLDMDGVLTDFEKRYIELFGAAAYTFAKKPKLWNSNWIQFVEEKHFETLDWFPGGKELLSTVIKTGIPFEILSSSGGEDFYEDIKSQKINWLVENGIDCPINVVPGKRFKRDYATPTSLIIDDTESVIRNFKEAGGNAIHHIPPYSTLMLLESYL
jgi:hypothetical protein